VLVEFVLPHLFNVDILPSKGKNYENTSFYIHCDYYTRWSWRTMPHPPPVFPMIIWCVFCFGRKRLFIGSLSKVSIDNHLQGVFCFFIGAWLFIDLGRCVVGVFHMHKIFIPKSHMSSQLHIIFLLRGNVMLMIKSVTI
jgi:hypothetical protein